MAGFVAPPQGVTCEGVLALDQKMLEQWRHSLETVWGSGGGKGILKKGLKAWNKVE